jgi:hypothetical protein
MAGRTVSKHTRVYINGYDLSGYSRAVGPLNWMFDETDLTVFTDAVKGALPAHATLGIGSLNGVMDNTADVGLHTILNAPGSKRTVMIPIGIQAAPAQGDPVYVGEFEQKDYMLETPYINIAFDLTSEAATSLLYSKPWGILLHAAGAETDVNAANGISDMIVPASTAFGGYMVYQVLAGDGTATIKCQDATTAGGVYADITGMTSGVIDCSTPKYGVVPIGRTATIRSYTRWQIVLGTASTVTFALAIVRATY